MVVESYVVNAWLYICWSQAIDMYHLPITATRQLYAFFIIELASQRGVHIGVTCHPTDSWVTQQLRVATPLDIHPTYLIRDNDSKFAAEFARVAADRGIKIL